MSHSLTILKLAATATASRIKGPKLSHNLLMKVYSFACNFNVQRSAAAVTIAHACFIQLDPEILHSIPQCIAASNSTNLCIYNTHRTTISKKSKQIQHSHSTLLPQPNQPHGHNSRQQTHNSHHLPPNTTLPSSPFPFLHIFPIPTPIFVQTQTCPIRLRM